MTREEKKLRKHFAQQALGYAVRKQRQKENKLRKALQRPPARERIDVHAVEDWDAFELPRHERMGPGAALRPAPVFEKHSLESGAPALAYDGIALGMAGDRLRVWLAGEERLASLAGSRLAESPVTGDEIALERVSGVERVVAIAPRRSQLVRPDPHVGARPRILAANVDLVVVVIAAGPRQPRPGLVDRILLAATRSGVAALVCLSKVDLAAAVAHSFLAPFAALGVAGLECSVMTGEGLEVLRQRLRGRRAVLVGQSGAGKTSLLNALVPGLALRTAAVRSSDGKGRHTTSAATLTPLPDGGAVLDTPGIRQFGLWAVSRQELHAYFEDIASLAAGCGYRDCAHLREPACAVRDAVERGQLAAARYQSYARLLEECAR